MGVKRWPPMTQLSLTTPLPGPQKKIEKKLKQNTDAPLTPLMRQYTEIKKQCPDAILFFRLGDFYEMFFEDAKLAAPILDIALTARDKKAKDPIPLCGVPHHSAKNYITKLLDHGLKVALCEQTEKPSPGKKLVARKITKIITPATRSTEEGLPGEDINWIVALIGEQSQTVVWMDVQEGSIKFTPKLMPSEAKRLITKINPSEIIVAQPQKYFESISNLIPCPDISQVMRKVETRFDVAGIKIKNLNLDPPVCQGVYVLFEYVESINLHQIGCLQEPKHVSTQMHLKMDASTIGHLDLFSKQKPSLYKLLNRTRSAVGARTLQDWIGQPLVDVNNINVRLDSVTALIEDANARHALQTYFKHIYDVGRSVNRIMTAQAKVKDLMGIRSTLNQIPMIREVLATSTSPTLKIYEKKIKPLSSLTDLLNAALKDQPHQGLDKTGIINDGYDETLDTYRKLQDNHAAWMADLETQERKRTDIPTLKIGYNKVFGYYLEATKKYKDQIPPDYIRKQTLVNAERFITAALKDREEQVLDAKSNMIARETELFDQIVQACQAEIKSVLTNQRHLGELDALASLAQVSFECQYTRPVLSQNGSLNIVQGRHPVVEQAMIEVPFVPNDVSLDAAQSDFMLLTGPNMAGKSTVMRQVALIVIMSQMGCYVPAKQATISVVDQIFTRIGAQDDVSQGQSTFMVEMHETAFILKQATSQSLILLDEIGRGTSTYDGLCIAWSVSQYIHDHIKAKTMFATHYHELAEFAVKFKRMACYQMRVRVWKDDIIFLRKLEPGRAGKSYGVEVAQLAGLPNQVLDDARKMLKHLESATRKPNIINIKPESLPPSTDLNPLLASLIGALKKTNMDDITPRQALDMMVEFKKACDGIAMS